MGAISVSSRAYDIFGNKQEVSGQLTMSSSYATNGDTFTAGQFGLARLDRLIPISSAGYTFQPDLTNLKIKAFTNVEVGNGTPLNGVTVDYIALGV